MIEINHSSPVTFEFVTLTGHLSALQCILMVNLSTFVFSYTLSYTSRGCFIYSFEKFHIHSHFHKQSTYFSKEQQSGVQGFMRGTSS